MPTFILLRANNRGKLTTIRLIDGLLEAESGEIWIDGQLLSSENVWNLRRQIGMVFQNPDNQFVGATVEDDVAFGLENQGLPREEMKKRVAESLELVAYFAARCQAFEAFGRIFGKIVCFDVDGLGHRDFEMYRRT